VWVPPTILTNRDVVDRVHARFTGDAEQWPLIELGIQLVFGASRSVTRHKNLDPGARIAAKAVEAARGALAAHDLDAEALDLLVYGGIGREYLEPATAMEVAARLGIERIRALDVTSACASQLLAVYTPMSTHAPIQNQIRVFT
jgi:3-oxoacyl-[acyl-carrier-protein] synthase-3